MNFLNLVLTSDDKYYNMMYDITSNYYKKFNNVKTIYYMFSNEIEDDYMLDNNILYIKGNETFRPGILDKTVKTFLYFKNDYENYDYIIRSNVSTIVNFNLLELLLNNTKIEYGGSPVWRLNGLPEKDGIMKPEYVNVPFVQGNSIIISKNMMQKIIDNIQFIDYDVIDDVAIGMLINSKFPDIIPYHINNRVFVDNCNGNYKELDNIMNHMIIQNKNNDRMIDINQMKYITAEGNEKYNYLIDIMYYNMCQNYSNIHEHLPTLKKYADECNSIIQLGYDQGNAIWAFIRAIRNNNKLLLVDNNPKYILDILDITNKLNLNFSYKWSNYLELEVDETFDLTFIDTWHVYGQMKRELAKFSKITNKYIIMHDTTVDEWYGESIRLGHDIIEESKKSGFPKEEIISGVWPAIIEFLTNNKEWVLHERYTNNNGLTILKKI
jgi:hypothetical protein